MKRWLFALAAVMSIGAEGDARGQTPCVATEGFADPATSLFGPVLRWASPGPDRGARALARLDAAVPMTRAIFFQPILSPELAALGDRLPLRVSTLIRAAALWGDENVPWKRGPDSEHSLAFAGKLVGRDFVFRPARRFASPEEPDRYAGRLSIRPVNSPPDAGPPERVSLELSGRFRFPELGIDDLVDLASEAPRYAFGNPDLPVDANRGERNGHDDALLGWVRRDMPSLLARIERHVRIANVIDVFETEAGQFVLVNVDARVRPEALRGDYPALSRFFDRVLSRMTGRVVVTDDGGRTWIRFGWEEGRIRFVAAVVDGHLSALDEHLRPVPGAIIEIDRVRSGAFHTETDLVVSALGIHAGLVRSTFRNEWERKTKTARLAARMVRAPEIEATAVLQALLRIAAGAFFQTLAGGGGGEPLRLALSSRPLGPEGVESDATLTGELLYAPALRLLVRLADRFSNELALSVRADQRRLFASFFDALIADLRSARERITGLERCIAEG